MDKLGSAEFPIPQFIVLGKQSVGKSRLVESLAGEQFNFVSGPCERFRGASASVHGGFRIPRLPFL